MTPATFICSLLTMAFVLTASVAAGQQAAPPPGDASSEPRAAESTGDDAAGAAAPPDGPSDVTTVPGEDEQPSPSGRSEEPPVRSSGVPRPGARSESRPRNAPPQATVPQPTPVAVPVAEAVAEAEEEARGELRPPGEAERMAPHPVDLERLRFVPGKGLEINSTDGRFRLRTRVRVQFRWTAEGDGEWQQQLRIRRARVVFDGHTFSEHVRYKFELAVSPNDVGVRDNTSDDPLARRPRRSPLLDFYVDFTHLRDLQLRVGQYKVPSNRQRVISSGNLQLVDRALLNSEFTLDRDMGFDLRSRDFLGLNMLRYYLGMYIARGRDSQGFDDFGMMYLARVEFLPLGMFKDYSEADFERGGPRLSFGAGVAYIDRARGDRGIRGRAPADGGTTDTQHVFADAVFMARGLSVLSEFAWRRGRRNPGDAVDEMGAPIPAAAPRDGYGFHIQAGYLLPRLPVEFALRYGLIRGVGSDTALGDRNELVAGFSYYAAQHPYKVQLDYARLWNASIDEGEHRVRLQLQVSL